MSDPNIASSLHKPWLASQPPPQSVDRCDEPGCSVTASSNAPKFAQPRDAGLQYSVSDQRQTLKASEDAIGLRYERPRPETAEPVNGTHIAQSQQRRWIINGDYLGLPTGGIARYGREVVAALDEALGEGHPLTAGLDLRIVAPRPPTPTPPLRHIPVQVLPEWRPRLPQVWVQMQLPRRVDDSLLSFCNLAPVRLRRQIVCVHDLQTFTTPQSYGRLFRLAHRVILPRLGRAAAAITTVSDISKQQIDTLGVASADKITVAYNGADHALRWRPDRASLDWTSGRPFVFGIARREAHKNAALFLGLAAPLEALGIDLVLAGDGAAEAFGPSPPPNVRLVGRIGDDDLGAAFGHALCFLFPSRAEGFGLPAVEAMTCSCPVIAATSSCLPEVCGSAALYADPDNPDIWVDAIRILQAQPHLRNRLIEAGLVRARRYTWSAVAETYLRLMLEVDMSSQISGMRQ